MIKDSAIIGRGPQADVDIYWDDLVSNKHAQVWREGRNVYIVDLGSMNGTYVNNKRIHGLVTLKPGDILKIGDQVVIIPYIPPAKVYR